jgi:hypothetical protein
MLHRAATIDDFDCGRTYANLNAFTLINGSEDSHDQVRVGDRLRRTLVLARVLVEHKSASSIKRLETDSARWLPD